MHRRIAGMGEGETQFRDGQQHTRAWCPQTNQKQRCGAHRPDLQGEQCRRRPRQQSCNPWQTLDIGCAKEYACPVITPTVI